jgi:predicted DCC family thiol-disulfide oxidoreductase YuxK
MNALVVYYDSRCGLCLAMRDWIGRQRQLVPVECRPKSPEMGELVVVADTGEVWAGNTAWLMVLWALVEYRDWSYRLADPLLLPTARTFFARVSKYRGSISCALGKEPSPGGDSSAIS